jgi:metal-responsive CopG/Arc/MetJ family transcriptional regulator
MQRVTITIDDELDAELDRFMRARGYANRSAATPTAPRRSVTSPAPA